MDGTRLREVGVVQEEPIRFKSLLCCGRTVLVRVLGPDVQRAVERKPDIDELGRIPAGRVPHRHRCAAGVHGRDSERPKGQPACRDARRGPASHGGIARRRHEQQGFGRRVAYAQRVTDEHVRGDAPGRAVQGVREQDLRRGDGDDGSVRLE